LALERSECLEKRKQALQSNNEIKKASKLEAFQI
jgi:hypothetical protein